MRIPNRWRGKRCEILFPGEGNLRKGDEIDGRRVQVGRLALILFSPSSL